MVLVSAGSLLRVWRTRAGLSQAAVAASLHTSIGALSMWESGARRINLAYLWELDVLYEADGALVDLVRAVDSTKGLAPRTRWAYNPQGPSRPHWAWMRPAPGRRRVDSLLLWGAFAFDCSDDCDDRGLIVISPISMPNPPVWVHLREPGWVDFGQGSVPDALPAPTLNALTVARLSTGGQSPVGLVAPPIVDRFRRDPEFAAAVSDFFGQKEDLIRQVFSATEPKTYVSNLTTGPDGPLYDSPPFDRRQYRALREARGLSQAEAALLATELLPDQPVSDDQIRVIERDGNPQARWLRSRLDMIYRADGYCGTEEVEVTGARSPFTVAFPRFWIGPVWVTLLSDRPTGAGSLQLKFGKNTKAIIARPGTTVTCRRAVPDIGPLDVSCPPGWRLRAGMGAHPEARDVNWGWRTVDDASSRGDAHVHEIFLGLFGRRGPEFDELVRRFTDGAS